MKLGHHCNSSGRCSTSHQMQRLKQGCRVAHGLLRPPGLRGPSPAACQPASAPSTSADVPPATAESLESFAAEATGPGAEAAMRVMAQRLAIDREGHHIFLCCDQTKAKCCSKDDGLRSWDFLKKRLKELGLENAASPVWRTKANCLRVCAMGPIAVVFSPGGKDKVYYHSCTPEALEEIVQSHILGGNPVDKYRIVQPAAAQQ